MDYFLPRKAIPITTRITTTEPPVITTLRKVPEPSHHGGVPLLVVSVVFAVVLEEGVAITDIVLVN